MKTFILISILLSATLSFAGLKEATYEVPTSQNDLKSSSLFKITKLSVTQDVDEVTTIRYMVPEELTGVKNVIEFSGVLANNSGHMTSEYGDLNCLSNTNQMMCTVSYQKLNFDSQLAKTVMASKFQGRELSNRLSLQEKFSTDPIGIIHIYFKSVQENNKRR